ncbi:class I SAM-dependent methyltransferase [Legionella genomosp. 1]|uniref:class I SAM-dependent methyltransferase n=1 Tax=Legionella genomosp. 1 TaxID=1093625 RepID=UPI001055A1E0|nr:class I SAM-dependent methyltransferase [Legionella genomosp. 1]
MDNNMENSPINYIHGYNQKETQRLYQQAKLIYHFAHQDLPFQKKERLLEIGSGVGAQTALLLKDFPNLHVTGIDREPGQVEQARHYLSTLPWTKWPDGTPRYEFLVMDATNLKLEKNKYDCAYFCYVLEHMQQPDLVLSCVREVLQPGSPISCYEELNETAYIYPPLPNVSTYWKAMNELQHEMGCDGDIGVRLGNLLMDAGFQNIQTQVHTFHHDNRNFSKKTEFFYYFRDILLTCSQTLLETKRISWETHDLMLEEINEAAQNPESAIVFFNMQALGSA